MAELKQNFRPKECATYIGISVSQVWNLAKQGKLHPIKLSRQVTIFRKSDIDKFIEQASGVNYEA